MANELKFYNYIINYYLLKLNIIFNSKFLTFLKKGNPFSLKKYKKLLDSVLVL